MKSKLINFSKGIGTIFLYFFISTIMSLLIGDYYFSDNMVVATIAQLSTYIVLLIVLFLVYHKRMINDFKNFKKDYLKIALRYWLIGLIAMIIANIIITSIVNNIAVNESLNRSLLDKYPISNIISMILLGPIIEEITFRASFKEAFSKWYTFATVTAILFGLAHIAEFKLLEFLFIIPYGALGFFFAKAFYDTDNIYTSIFMHILHNTYSVILIFLM